MFLKNYTSDVPVNITIERIERLLIKCKVAGITKNYDERGNIEAICFGVPSIGGNLVIRIPANEQAAIDALWHNYADGDKISPNGNEVYNSYKKKKKTDFIEQGRRTAWKIMQDWIEVQMSMIQMKQADTLEVFLPYVWDGKQTVYHRAVAAGGIGRLLLAEKVD